MDKKVHIEKDRNIQITVYQKETDHQNYLHETCKSKFLIYLMECVLCRLRYVVKSKSPFNLRIDNLISDEFDKNAIRICRHFAQGKYRFNKHCYID